MSGIEILMAVGTLASVGGSIMAGKQQAAANNYNARVMEAEAKASEQEASFEATRVRDRAKRVLSSQRAAAAKAGLDLEGSPLLLMEDTAAQAEIDALLVEQAGDRNAARARSQAALDRLAAKSAKTNSYWSAGASLLNGASKIYSLQSGG